MADEAAKLPGFDIASDQPQQRGDVPFERFFVELGDAPVRGPEAAPVTIVAFSDFECPYCERGHRTIQQVEREYGEKVRVAYKAYPLDFHSHAMVAALAAKSAQEQGKFWEFHDKLFANQSGLGPDLLLSTAKELGLDTAKFTACMADPATKAFVDADMKAGEAAGVEGTPSFFLNGVPTSAGVPTPEQVKALL